MKLTFSMLGVALMVTMWLFTGCTEDPTIGTITPTASPKASPKASPNPTPGPAQGHVGD